MIESPFSDLEAWVQYYGQADVPVLRHSLTELVALRDRAEEVNARMLANVIMRDPLLTLRVLAYIERRRRATQNADITTIERALIMIGVQPFFRDFDNLPLVDERLKPYPKALIGLLKVATRARRAAGWAKEWAVIRHDLDVDEITVAALLHDAAEILMWCFAPNLALRVRDMQTADRTLRSAVAQTEVYGIRLHDLQMALVRTWRLPELLTTMMDRNQSDNPRVRNVALAVDLARHSANGWDDAALPDDYRAIEQLLHIDHGLLMHKLGLDQPPQPPQPQ